MTQEQFKDEARRLRPRLMELDPRSRNCLSLGFGIDWKNYRMTDDMLFTKDYDGNVTVEKFPLEFEPKFSRIKVFSLTATLRYQHNFGDGFSIGFGPVVNSAPSLSDSICKRLAGASNYLAAPKQGKLERS